MNIGIHQRNLTNIEMNLSYGLYRQIFLLQQRTFMPKSLAPLMNDQPIRIAILQFKERLLKHLSGCAQRI